jgi:hypothetical protein
MKSNDIPPGIFYSPDYECFFDSEENLMSDEFDEIWMSRANEFPIIILECMYWN